MQKSFSKIRRDALDDVARFMCVAARTAPKTRGQDHLVIGMLTKAEKKRVMARMRLITKRDKRPSCARDAGNIRAVDQVVVIGVKSSTLGLDCGFCGFRDCKTLKKARGVCAYNSMDLGIALGSAAALAARYHADNRLMYSIGKAAMELKLMGKGVVQAIGIPLSGTGKNPFFDRDKPKKAKKTGSR